MQNKETPNQWERERERGSTRSSKIERETLSIMWWCRPGFNLALPCLFLCRVYLVVKFSYPSQYNPVIYNIILLNIKFNNVHTLIALISNSDFIRYLSIYGPHFLFSICLDRWKLIAYAFHLFFFFFSFFLFGWERILALLRDFSGSCTPFTESINIFFSAKLSIKMGPTIIFTHLKIILLQYF